MIQSLIMSSDSGEILISLKSICSVQWQLEIFDRDEANEWRWTAGAVGLHHNLLQMGMRYATDRIGQDAKLVEIKNSGKFTPPRPAGRYH